MTAFIPFHKQAKLESCSRSKFGSEFLDGRIEKKALPRQRLPTHRLAQEPIGYAPDSRAIVTVSTRVLSIGQTSFEISTWPCFSKPGMIARRTISLAGTPRRDRKLRCMTARTSCTSGAITHVDKGTNGGRDDSHHAGRSPFETRQRSCHKTSI